MTLDQYLKTKKITDAQFAALIGVDRSYITRLRRGRGNPTRGILHKIVIATGRLVTSDSLLGLSPIEPGL